MVDRLQALSDYMSNLQSATVWERPFVFFKSFQWDIAKDTLRTYEPGLTFSIEGSVYCLAGIICGYGFYYCLRRMGAGLFIKRRACEKIDNESHFG